MLRWHSIKTGLDYGCRTMVKSSWILSFFVSCYVQRQFRDIQIFFYTLFSSYVFISIPSPLAPTFLHLFLLPVYTYLPYCLSFAHHLQISSFHNVSDQLSFISSYYVSIASRSRFPNLLCNVYHLTSFDPFIPQRL